MVKALSAAESSEQQEIGPYPDTPITEADDEVLSGQIRDARPPLVLYEILHSPSYRVPVLYIRFNDFSIKGTRRSIPTLDETYDLLVPKTERPAMQQVGVMGALSLTDHPVNNLPAYFVHPCRTSEAMAAITDGTDVKPIQYLLIWIGLIGSSAGLVIPRKLAQKINASTE